MYTRLTSFSPSPPLSTHTCRSRSSHVFHFLHSSPIFLVGLLKSQCIQSRTKYSLVSDPLLHHLHTSLSAFPMNFLHEARLAPTTDLHVDAVWALATKRDPATQLELCEQRSKTTPEGTMAHIRFPTVATNTWQDPPSRRRIQAVRPPYEKVQVPSRIFPVDTDSARGILPVGFTAIRSEGADGVGALGHTSGCHRVSFEGSVPLIDDGS